MGGKEKVHFPESSCLYRMRHLFADAALGRYLIGVEFEAMVSLPLLIEHNL